MEKEMFRDMGSKIDVFSKYEEWEHEYKRSNSVVVCLAKLLGFSVGIVWGLMKGICELKTEEFSS